MSGYTHKYKYYWVKNNDPNRLRWIVSPGLNQETLINRFFNLGFGTHVKDFIKLKMGLDFIIDPEYQDDFKTMVHRYFTSTIMLMKEAKDLSEIVNEYETYRTEKRYISPIDKSSMVYRPKEKYPTVRREQYKQAYISHPTAWDKLIKMISEVSTR